MLPKPVKRFLESQSLTELFVTPGSDGCLELHTRDSLDEVHQRVQAGTNLAANIRTFSRMFYAQAESCEVDGQHRIRIPKRLAEWANLEKDLTVVGVGDHWEVWSQSAWEQYFQSHQNNFDEVVALAMDECTIESTKLEKPKVPR